MTELSDPVQTCTVSHAALRMHLITGEALVVNRMNPKLSLSDAVFSPLMNAARVVLLGIVYVKVELASSEHTTVIATTRKISGQNKDDLSFTSL